MSKAAPLISHNALIFYSLSLSLLSRYALTNKAILLKDILLIFANKQNNDGFLES